MAIKNIDMDFNSYITLHLIVLLPYLNVYYGDCATIFSWIKLDTLVSIVKCIANNQLRCIFQAPGERPKNIASGVNSSIQRRNLERFTGREALTTTQYLHLTNQRCFFHPSHQ